jgi:hypothetical protein
VFERASLLTPTPQPLGRLKSPQPTTNDVVMLPFGPGRPAGPEQARNSQTLPAGALLHVVNVATGGDYAGFADPSHFAG